MSSPIKTLTHLNALGEAQMVDVSSKNPSVRTAVARAEIVMKPETLKELRSGRLKKGDAFTVAKIAGILAAKKTDELIPLCHSLPVEHVEIQMTERPAGDGIVIQAEVRTTARTGAEMEALTGAAMAALSLYDMAKASDLGMVITGLHLVKKTGGKRDYDQSRSHYRL